MIILFALHAWNLSYVDELCDRAADPILCLFELQWCARLLLRHCKYDPREFYLSLLSLCMPALLDG